IWYTISNGSKSYVEKIFKLVGEKNFIHEKVLKINQQKKYITTSKGGKYKFDHVIIATHTDSAKKILSKITLDQKKLLNMVKYRSNTAIMHTDTSVMPKNKNNWSSWNFLNRKKTFALTYWMNLLQNLTIDKNIFVSINCDDKIKKNKIIKKIKYSHPVFNNKTQDIKNKLNEVQGENGVWFAGAWQGYGFHEDGLKSALRIVKKIR
ncbi:MAG: amine oxidase, partial [Pelagibacteraceae bacterium]